MDNAGGNSKVSEMHSIDLLMKKLNASNCLFENSVEYWCWDKKMVDFILSVPVLDKEKNSYDITRIGVSVTRAFDTKKFPFTRESAIKLIKKKLNGLVIARNCVVEEQCFYQSVLHIWSPNEKVTELLLDVIHSKEIDFLAQEVVGTMDIWITTTNYTPVFTDKI